MTLMTSIVLTQAHTHAGKPYKAGERLDVDSGSGKPTELKPTTSHRKEPKS